MTAPDLHAEDHLPGGRDPMPQPIGAWCSFVNATADQTVTSGSAPVMKFPDLDVSYGMDEIGWTPSWFDSGAGGSGFLRLTPDSPFPADNSVVWMVGVTLRCSAAVQPGGQCYIYLNSGGRFSGRSFHAIPAGFPSGEVLSTPPILVPWPEDPSAGQVRISVQCTIFQNTGNDWTVLKATSTHASTAIWAVRVA